MDLDDIERMTDAEVKATGVNAIARIIGRHVQGCAESDDLDQSGRLLLNRSISVLDRIRLLENTAEAGALLAIKTMALGKLGEFSQAIECAFQAYENHPTWHTAVAVANACRRAGDLRQAAQMWSVASDLDPQDVTALLEIGDTYMLVSQWAAAINYYERALERQPEQAWAVPSIHYCRFRLTGDNTALQHLRTLADQQPDECGVEKVLAKLTGSYSSNVGIQRARDLLERAGT